MTPNSSTHRTGSPLSRGTATTLTAVSAYAVVAAGLLWLVEGIPPAVRLALALPLVLVVPGYAVVTALFPATGGPTRGADAGSSAGGHRTDAGLTALERGVLAIAVSIAVVPMVALAAAAVVGVVVGPILAGIAGVTVVASVIAVLRGPSGDSIAARQSDGRGDVGRASLGAIRDSVVTDRITQVAVVLTALLLVVSGAVAFTGPPGDAGSTEFYLVNETGASGESAGEASNGTGVFDLRITHHGTAPQQYTTVALLDQSEGAGSEGGAPSTTELRRSSTEVAPDETAAVTYRVDESELAGNATVRFLLYEGEAPSTADPETALRALQLSVDETAE